MHSHNVSTQDARVDAKLPAFVTLSPMDLAGMQSMQYGAYFAFYAECYRRALAAVNAKALAALGANPQAGKMNNFAVSRNMSCS